MGVYKIKDLEELTGIKAHTIRIWEKRYQLFEPNRTKTNIRTYSENDLRKLLNVAVLNDNGYKISKIADLPDKKINELIKEFSLDASETSSNDMFLAMLEFDEHRLRGILEKYYSVHGAQKTFTGLVIPIMKKIGVLWQVNSVNPIQEHFVSNIVRDFIICKSSALVVDEAKPFDYVLFLHENETHELSLLFYNLILRAEGFKTLYLGARVPLEELLGTLKQISPKKVVSSFISCVDETFVNGLYQAIARALPQTQVVFGGYYIDLRKAQLDTGITTIDSVKNLF